MSHTTTIRHDLDAGACEWAPGASFECALCGHLCCYCCGGGDAVDIMLGGICNDCAMKLPEHVIEAAEVWDERRMRELALWEETEERARPTGHPNPFFHLLKAVQRIP